MGKQAPTGMGELGPKRIDTRAKTADGPSERESRARESARLRQVSVFRLKPHPLQPLERHSDGNVRELMESIHSIGLQEPPLVRRMPDGEYVILAGHRRVRAWQLLALDGRVAEKLRVFVLTDISDRDAIYIIAAEYAHRRDYDFLHTARVIGSACEERRQELGREPTAQEVADVVPWEESSVAAYRKVYEALEDPRLTPLVQRLERPDISLLYKVLGINEFSTKVAVLEAFHEGGTAGARKALSAGKGGRPENPVVRTKRGKGFDLKFRVRPTNSVDAVQTQLEEAERLVQELRRRLMEDGGDEVT